jgi:hypothetical protein
LTTVTRIAWLGFLLAVIVQLVPQLLHRTMPIVAYASVVVELVCAAVIVIVEGTTWWRQHRRGGE